MLFFCLLFLTVSLSASDNQINETLTDLHFVRPKDISREEFKIQLINLVNNCEKEPEVKKRIIAQLNEKEGIEHLILPVSKNQLSQILPYLYEINDQKDDKSKKIAFAKINLVPWVSSFYDKYKESLSARSGISLNNLKVFLGLLSGFVIEQGNEQDDSPSKEVQLLQLFNIVYKRIFIDVHNVIQKTLINQKEEGKKGIDVEITGEVLLIELYNALETVNLELKIDQNNQILVSDEKMKTLTDKVIDLIAKRFQEEDEKKEKNAVNIVRFLTACNIPKDEFAAMTKGQQGIAILISSILIDSSIGKEFSKNVYQDYRDMLLDLERIFESVKKNLISNKKMFNNNNNSIGRLLGKIFEEAKDDIYLLLSKKLMLSEFINIRCIIKDEKIYFNENFLSHLIEGIFAEKIKIFMESENTINNLPQLLGTLQKSASLPAQSASCQSENSNTKKLSERQIEAARLKAEQKKIQEEELKRKQEELERQKQAQLEKIEKAKQAKEEKAKQAALVEEQKAKAEAERQKLKRQKELERQAKLHEIRKKEQEVQERFRLLKVELEDKEKNVRLELTGAIEIKIKNIIKEIQEALFQANLVEEQKAEAERQKLKIEEELKKQAELNEVRKKEQEALFRAKLSENYKIQLLNESKISSSKGFIHNPYARLILAKTDKKEENKDKYLERLKNQSKILSSNNRFIPNPYARSNS